MEEKLNVPSIGEILNEEFIKPYNITAYRLAKDIRVPTSRIIEIVNGHRRISIETGLRLAKYFGTSDKFFINLQANINIRNEKMLKLSFSSYVKILGFYASRKVLCLTKPPPSLGK